MAAAALAAVGVGIVHVATAAEPKPDNPPKSFLIGASSAYHEECPGAQKAISYYRQAFAQARASMRATGPPARVWYGCDAARRRAIEWREKAHVAVRQLKRWVAYHYHWWEWMPAKWQRVGACETGYGRRPGNFHHANSRYVSAFGISRQAYDEDARVYGAPPWDDRNPPTPRQQFLAALGHYHLHGGFSGWGCRGA